MKLSLVKDLTLGLVEQHHDSDGVGPDSYQPAPMRHAMAEGKFLASISKLVKAQVLNRQRAETMAAASLSRLEKLQSETEHGVAFGLGFGWKGTLGSVPFTITTAIVTDGLDQAASMHSNPEPFLKMASATKDWLTSDAVIEPVSQLPKFSPNDPTIVTNVVGFWAHVLRSSHPQLARTGRHHVESTYLPEAGWTYTPSSSRLDLLHTCYTARILLDRPEQVRRIAAAVSRFVTPMGLIDKADVLTLNDANAAAKRSTGAPIVVEEMHAYLLHPVPARPWSIGELLTVCASRPGGGMLLDFWRSLALKSTDHLGSMDLVAEGPRHAMHAADGLASHLAAERTESR
jgi:hypothetical protein